MSNKKEILKHARAYFSGTVLTQGVTLAATVLTRRFLGPVNVGIWALVQVVLRYSSYSTLGTMSAAAREIPFWRGKGEPAKADHIKNLVFSYGMVSSVIIAIGIGVFAFAAKSHLKKELFYGLLFTSVLLLLQRLNNLLITFLRAYKEFSFAAKQMVFSSFFNAIIVTLLAYRYEIYGYMFGMCLSFIFNIVYILQHQKLSLRWTFDYAELKKLALFGMPLLFLGLLATLVSSIDKILIAKYLDLKELGLYSVAGMACTYIANFSNSVGVVLIPNFHEMYGKNEKIEDLKTLTTKSGNALCDSMLVLIGGAWILSPSLIRWALPEFIACLPALKVLILSSFFFTLCDPYECFTIAVKKHWGLVPILAVTCLVSFLLTLLALKAGYGITGVAYATFFVMFFRFSGNYFLAANILYTSNETLKHYGDYLLRFAYAAGLLVLTELVHFKWVSLTLFIQFLILTGGFLPLLNRLNNEFDLLSVLKNKLSNKKEVTPLLRTPEILAGEEIAKSGDA